MRGRRARGTMFSFSKKGAGNILGQSCTLSFPNAFLTSFFHPSEVHIFKFPNLRPKIEIKVMRRVWAMYAIVP